MTNPFYPYIHTFLTLNGVIHAMEQLEAICDGQLADRMHGSFEAGSLSVSDPNGNDLFHAAEYYPNVWDCFFHKSMFKEGPFIGEISCDADGKHHEIVALEPALTLAPITLNFNDNPEVVE